MFQNNILPAFFYLPKYNNILTQKFYKIYKFFLLNKQKINFIEFFTYTYVYSTNFKNILVEKTFLNFFFFVKTPKTLSLFNVNSFTDVRLNTILKIPFVGNSHKILNFWKKFKKLKRPKTEDDFNFPPLKGLEKKLHTYNQLGFILLENSVYLVRCKSETFFKNYIFLKKTLLLSPKLQSSSVCKFFHQNQLYSLEFQFLRKNKVYNKGRYSRCRQNYRTGVYMCMYLSIISIFGLYYWFYRFSFNFTYLWWLFIISVGSFFLPKIIKYRLYEPITFLNKVVGFFKWFFLVCKSFF